MTRGQSKISWRYWQNKKGIMCPKCMLSEEGPRPVYRKKGFFCSYRSKILLNSLLYRSHITEHLIGLERALWTIERAEQQKQHQKKFSLLLPVGEKDTATKQDVRLAASQVLHALQDSLIDGASAELLDQTIIVDAHLLAVHNGALNVPRVN